LDELGGKGRDDGISISLQERRSPFDFLAKREAIFRPQRVHAVGKPCNQLLKKGFSAGWDAAGFSVEAMVPGGMAPET
jgi:hypothetical protein